MEKNIDPKAKKGMRIRLIKMSDDFAPVDSEMEGTIRSIDDIGTIHVNWDDGRTLGVIPGVDEYQLLPPEGEQVGIEVFGEAEEGPITKRYSQEFKRISNSTKPKVKLETKDDKVEGGLSDKLTVQDIAKKHKVPIGDIRKEIKKGTKVEMEHTDDKTLAKEIAMDHITEFPDFYSNPKHGAIASEKELEKIHESLGDEFKTALQRIVDVIRTTRFQHKESTEKMIDNFYHKYKDRVDNPEKFNEIYINLKEKLENKFNVEEVTAAAGGGSTGAFVGPLKTEKNESVVIKKGDLINEISRTHKLRDGGAYDGNSWVGDKDGNGWLFDDKPAWEDGEIIDILTLLDIDWKDESLSITSEQFQKGVDQIINEGWLKKTPEDKVALRVLDRLKKEFPQNARYDDEDWIITFNIGPDISIEYNPNDYDEDYLMLVNDRRLQASDWALGKIYNYVYKNIKKGTNSEEEQERRRRLAQIELDLNPDYAQDVFDKMNEGRFFKTKEDRLALSVLERVKEEFPQDAEYINYRYSSGGFVRFFIDGVRGRTLVEVSRSLSDLGLIPSYRMEVNSRELLASRWVMKKLFKYVYNIIEDTEDEEDLRNIEADLIDPDDAGDVFDQLGENVEPNGGYVYSDGYKKMRKELEEVEGKDIHKAKWKRCVEKVKKNSPDVNPYAVCTDSIGYEGSIKKAHRRKDEAIEEGRFDNFLDKVKSVFVPKCKECGEYKEDVGSYGLEPEPAYVCTNKECPESDWYYGRHLKENYLNEGENSALVFVVLFLSSILSQIPIKQWPQYLAENSRDMFVDFLKFMKKFGYSTDTDYVKNNFDSLLKKGLGKLYKEGGVNQDLDETTTFASALGDSGTYVTPAFAAKKGKHGPSKKPIWKGGTIVQNIKSDGVLVKEDFDWVGDVETSFHVGDKIDTGKDIRKITDIDYDYSSNYQKIEYRSSLGFKSEMISTAVKKHLESGKWRIIDDGNPITEINKIKWVKDGKYVKLKDKCTKFNNQPWCNSGNASDPLELSDTTNENIDNISEKYNIPKEYILEKIKTKINR